MLTINQSLIKDLNLLISRRDCKLFLFALALHVLGFNFIVFGDHIEPKDMLLYIGTASMLPFLFIFIVLASTSERANWEMNAAFRRITDLESRIKAPEVIDSAAGPAEVVGWPWGTHTTKALADLEAAGSRYWGANYDRTDPGTAPTNEIVMSWLIEQRGCTTNMARSIASILRADGLKPGPRG